ncbi:MAG: 3D domain-containing protein [Acidobacteria bacterium]|nr:3D domain-containing protein [Acidobacteriota bacterium]
MIISRSFWRKTLATIVAAVAFVWLYEVTILDSKYAARLASQHNASAPPTPGARVAYTATAYCKGMVTTSGVAVQSGVAAADPELLPVGSVVQIDDLPPQYDGIYTILDTGPSVQGRQVDVYMWSCYEALDFGRRPIRLTVLRLGWNPRATTPGFIDRLFKRPEVPALPSRPLPQVGK